MPDVERLADLLADPDLLTAIAAGCWRQAPPDRSADPLQEKSRESRGRSHDTLHAHPGFREPQVEREIGFRCKAAVNRDQIADPGNLRREHDPVVRLAELLGERRGADRALEHPFESDLLRLERLGAA